MNMAKKIENGNEKLIQGINVAADLVSKTLGPKGKAKGE